MNRVNRYILHHRLAGDRPQNKSVLMGWHWTCSLWQLLSQSCWLRRVLVIWRTVRGGTRGEFGSWWKEPVWYNSGIGGKLEVGSRWYIISSTSRPVDNLIFNTNSQSYQAWSPWLLFLNQDRSRQVALNLARADNAGNQHYKARALSGAWEISDIKQNQTFAIWYAVGNWNDYGEGSQ